MKGLKRFDKIIFFVNTLAAFLLLLSYILPYIPPKSFSFLSVLSLGVPLLIIINVLFFLYWLFKVKKQLLLSLVALLLGFTYVTSLYKFTGSKAIEDASNFSVMNYNVRLFNLFDWLPSSTVETDILNFIKQENPSVLSLQEYHRSDTFKLEGYYKYENVSDGKVKSGQAIFSKYPIVNSGSIEFNNTSNNAIFIDVVKGADTIRIYNLHLQSSKINTEVSELKKETSEKLAQQVGDTFKMQQDQAELFLLHRDRSPYKSIISGDFNNTAYSYIYNKIKGKSQDAFDVAGNGFGRTYDFKFFPIRIDFIFADLDFTVNGFKTYDVKLSDHYPIKATLKLH
ncbi:endonuclease/exonuclease/phosphatase family protein [Winogradskyella immobilis]|uniref:Endonuclease/exonuclease/phosphatase family protein n=1 Tax=Winogradskyella immobilis TaxID=2816852 RepID=A0ABS8EPL3_9FLAO|nr:endonuclease/exonuclease/phosphatase family protein [Winogradskyella immobilis]MCC1484941.1 endonuclease/exonuclease/phosphatase family protein [Winogradskyella immobilis]MCG0017033.1 endonuclease/exonuclease/phosphatase family protein [Winogradskyella immobilis]